MNLSFFKTCVNKVNAVFSNNLVVYDSLLYFLAKLAPGISNFFSITVFLYFLSKEEYGRYSLMYSVTLLISAVLVTWINQSQLRFFARDSQEETFSKAIRQGIIYCILVLLFLICFFGIPLVLQKIISFNCLFSIFFLSLSLVFYQVRITLSQAKLDPFGVIKLEFFRSLTFILFPLILILLSGADNKPEMVLLGIACSYFFSLFSRSKINNICQAFLSCSLSFFKKKDINCNDNSLIKHSYDYSIKQLLGISLFLQTKDICKNLVVYLKPCETLVIYWKYSFPITVWIGLFLMIPTLDKLLIGIFLSPKELGEYSAYFDLISRSFTFFLHPILLATKSRAMFLWTKNEFKNCLLVIKKGMVFEMMLILPILILYFIASTFLSTSFLHISQPRPFYYLMMPIILSSFIWNFSLLAQLPFELTGKTIFMPCLLACCLFLGGIANFIQIPYFGLTGVAYLGMLYSALYLFLVLFFRKKLSATKSSFYL